MRRRACERTEHPVLFCGEMVRALLDGRKTQTRRVARIPQWIVAEMPDAGVDLAQLRASLHCPYGKAGDTLWVRERWASLVFRRDWETGHVDDWWPSTDPKRGSLVYGASDDGFTDGGDSVKERGFSWHPSILMPRWASRITLEVEQIRLERVQDITHDDAIAEGCFDEHLHDASLPRDVFRQLWDELNGTRKRGVYAWNRNPLVWAVTFHVQSTKKPPRLDTGSVRDLLVPAASA